MDRERALAEALRLVSDQEADAAEEMVRTWQRENGDPLAIPLIAFTSFMAARHDDAAAAASTARDLGSTDPTVRACTAAVLGLVAAATDEASLGDPFATMAAAVEAVGTEDRCSAFARYLAVEGALAAARLDLAVALRPPGRPPHEVWAGHPYAGVMLACEARLAAFSGRIDDAQALLTAEWPAGLVGHLLRATGALVAGNAADVATMRALIAEVEAADVEPREYLGRGIHLLLAFAVVALGDRSGAARHLLRAGGDADLTALTVVDRALGYELLVAAAVDEEDLDAASSWLARASQWRSHRAAEPCVERMFSRVALLADEADLAIQHAERAVALARAEGRAVEAAEGEIVLARARIASNDVPVATRALRDAVNGSDQTGHHAMRQAASRTLRTAGRRLHPVTGGGRASLSARERDVADLILAGVDSADIAERLHLSPATVRAHCSRVLTAYGAATRIGLLAAVNTTPQDPVRPGDLTTQQSRVAELVARAETNQQIADALGISVKGVEKHVGDILVRWDQRTRFGIARTWWDLQR